MEKSALTGILLAVILGSAHPALGQDPKEADICRKVTPFKFDKIQGQSLCWSCFG